MLRVVSFGLRYAISPARQWVDLWYSVGIVRRFDLWLVANPTALYIQQNAQRLVETRNQIVISLAWSRDRNRHQLSFVSYRSILMAERRDVNSDASLAVNDATHGQGDVCYQRDPTKSRPHSAVGHILILRNRSCDASIFGTCWTPLTSEV